MEYYGRYIKIYYYCKERERERERKGERINFLFLAAEVHFITAGYTGTNRAR